VQRVSTTVVALVGPEARALAEALGEAANVRAVLPDAEAAPLDRAVQAWREAQGAHIPYLVHDADPLAEVAAAFERWYDQKAGRGELEVAVTETVARWRARNLELPDYYLVVDAESLGATSRHWYLGFLHQASPVRVLPAPADPLGAAARITHLPAGRWWPDLDRLLADVDRAVPNAIRPTPEPAT
jgi:hypothetical protein